MPPPFVVLFLLALLSLNLACVPALPRQGGLPEFQDSDNFGNFTFGTTPLNFDRFDRARFNASSPNNGEIDVAAALQSLSNSYCAPGGGYAEYGTGPFCQNNCHNCLCNHNADGSYTWCGYPYDCVGYTWGLENLNYGAAEQQPGPPFVIQEVFHNSLNETQSFQFTKSESYANTYSWTFTQTVSDTISVEISAQIPEVCSVKDSFSATISASSSETQTQTHTNSWSVSQSFTVPPLTSVQATMTISTTTFNLPYTANIRFQGAGYAWCKGRVNGHYCWFFYASNFLNFDGCYTSDGMDAICPFSGHFYGLQGVEATVSISKV